MQISTQYSGWPALSTLTKKKGKRIASGGGNNPCRQSALSFEITRGEMTREEKQEEITKLKKESERLAKDIESKKTRLADEAFLSKAPAKIVEDLKATLASREIETSEARILSD